MTTQTAPDLDPAAERSVAPLAFVDTDTRCPQRVYDAVLDGAA